MGETVPKSVRNCEIVTRLTDDTGNSLFDMENMEKVFSDRSCIDKYAYIVHDHDIYTADDEERNPAHKKGSTKPPHIHAVLHFDSPQHFKNIACWFGIPENFVSKIKGKWIDALLYLIHENAPDKYQYDPGSVTASFDYTGFIADAMENGGRGSRKKKENPVDPVIEKILSGEIPEYRKTLDIDQKLLVSYSRKIELAFKTRSEFLQATCKERHTECIYITGSSDAGKTTLARLIAENRHLDYCITSGNNDILDGYAQEPCLIIDEIRPSTMPLSDLLKMLDPHTACSVKSRYKNKYLNCNLIILTTVLDIDTFYSNVFSEEDEPIIQLKRRCGTYIRMDQDNIFVSLWDSANMRYSPPVAYKNNILEKYTTKKRKTVDDVILHVAELLPGLELEEDKDINPNLYRSAIMPEKKQVPHINEVISDDEFRKILNRQD